jgi:hypothetical protein
MVLNLKFLNEFAAIMIGNSNSPHLSPLSQKLATNRDALRFAVISDRVQASSERDGLGMMRESVALPHGKIELRLADLGHSPAQGCISARAFEVM